LCRYTSADLNAQATIEADVIAAIAASAGIDPSRVRLTGFSKGSLIVHFEIDLEDDEGTTPSKKKEEEEEEGGYSLDYPAALANPQPNGKSKASGRWDHLRRLHAALAAVSAAGCAGLGAGELTIHGTGEEGDFPPPPPPPLVDLFEVGLYKL
jgi:hypothetical protein